MYARTGEILRRKWRRGRKRKIEKGCRGREEKRHLGGRLRPAWKTREDREEKLRKQIKGKAKGFCKICQYSTESEKHSKKVRFLRSL